jgi:hypothetical protein
MKVSVTLGLTLKQITQCLSNLRMYSFPLIIQNLSLKMANNP